jgi:hypothetical protein
MDTTLTEWLLEHAGPTVRYRTAAELLDDPSAVDLERLERDLLASPLVKRWLPRLAAGEFHSMKNTAFENAMNKLVDLGLRAGMKPLDHRAAHFRKWLTAEARRREHWGDKVIAAAGLLRAGYPVEEPVTGFLRWRLDDLQKTCRKGAYDIYLDEDGYADIPRSLRGKRFLKPEFATAGEVRLPWIHDMYWLAHFPADARDATTARKIAAIVRYVLDPGYQAIQDGYGWMSVALPGQARHHYAIGWSAHLPDCGKPDLGHRQRARLVQRVELMAHFPAAWKMPLFQRGLAHLEAHRTERGTYLFSRDYLKEQLNGYWVTGACMGLEENRRPAGAIEVESTFRMLKIKRLMGEA